MRTTLALDISLNTGYAVDTDERIVFGTKVFKGVSGDYAVIGRRFSEWLVTIFDVYLPDHLVIERSFNRFNNVTYLLSGLTWEAHRIAEARSIPRFEYSPVSVKKHATGHKHAIKKQVMEAIRAKGHKITNDHEGDAVALLYLHAEKMRMKEIAK